MTTAAADPTSNIPLRRIAIASCAGTTIEYYDFFIYGTAAALVFPKVFFPSLGSAAGTVASFATLAVAFLSRPLGSVLFGHFGDRLGRKKTLIATLLMMGIGTALVGLLPSAEAIGPAAPILLVVLRFSQGVGLGGEWGGATLLAAEYAPRNRRGRYAIFPQVGPAIAFLLSSGTFMVSGALVSEKSEAFLSYGWRIPFVASFVLVLVGLYVRLKIAETPVFRAAQQRPEAERPGAPVRQMLRNQAREVLLTGGLLTVLFALFYVGTAYLTSFGTSASGAGLSRMTVLALGMVAALVLGVATAVSGVVSDRLGRRRVILLAFAVTIPFVLVLYPLLGTGSPVVFGITLAVTLGVFGIAYGPVGAYLPEMFATRYRYTGAGVGYNLGGLLGGAVVPLLAVELANDLGVYAVGIMLAVVAVLSLLCTLALRETRSRRLDEATPMMPAAVDPEPTAAAEGAS